VASEFLVVAQQVLESERRPLSAREIVDLARERGLFSDKRAGKTPYQTMKSKLSVHVRTLGDGSTFVRTSAGRFALRSQVPNERIYAAPRLEPSPPKERVLVFPSLWLEARGRFQGLRRTWKSLYTELLSSGVLEYLDRRAAEDTEDFKQIITYVLVTRGSSVLSFTRGHYSRVSEALKGRNCIGFGGHVAESDTTLFDASDHGISRCAIRELSEELVLPREDQLRLARGEGLRVLGLLNDDSSRNGQRHFAVVFQYEVSNSPAWEHPAANERSVTQLAWMDPSSPAHSLFDYEYWSQLCLVTFYGRASITRSTFRIRRRRMMVPPHLLVVVGQVGSGKSATTALLRQEYGYHEVNSGRAVASVLGVPPIPGTPRGRFNVLSWELVCSKSGPRRIADALLLQASQAGDRVIIDGIRQRATLEHLRQLASPKRVAVLYVHTPFNVAFEFFQSREGPQTTLEQFMMFRTAPVEREVEQLLSFADVVLFNWSGRDQFARTVRQLMRELNTEPVKTP
jgi:predicted NUDIX family phosphoesterase/dephospho-CoA kinase